MQDEQRVSKANALEFAAQSRTLRVAAAAIRQRESNERTLKKQKRKNDLLKLRQAKEANKSGEGTNIAVQEKAQKKGSDDEMETSGMESFCCAIELCFFWLYKLCLC